MTRVRSPFGLLAFLHWNHDWNNFHFDDALRDRAIEQLTDLGIDFIRIDILWSDIHRGTDQYDFSRYDKLVSELARHKIEVLPLLQYNKFRETAQGVVWNHPPDSFDEFARYVGATVRHFKGQIKFWEIWNEPNHPVYWAPPPDHLKEYSRLLKLSYAAAKKADPSCMVLNGGLTEPLKEGMEDLYAQGCKDFFDVLSIHTFVDPLDPNTQNRFAKIISDVTAIMKRYNDASKKIWITEMGCPGIPEGLPSQPWFSGGHVNENQQANWMKTQYGLLKIHPALEKMFWAFYRDTPGMFKDGTDYLGIVREDLSPKAAFWTMKDLIKAHRDKIKK